MPSMQQVVQDVQNVAAMLPGDLSNDRQWAWATAMQIVALAYALNSSVQTMFREIANAETMLPGDINNDRKWAWQTAIQMAKMAHKVP
jgi:hypothetical protein